MVTSSVACLVGVQSLHALVADLETEQRLEGELVLFQIDDEGLSIRSLQPYPLLMRKIEFGGRRL